jgi:hypothetical protein
LDDGATTTLAVVAYDAAGNSAASSEIQVKAVHRPLLINEIGWGGDTTSHANQWIELKNLTAETLDLSHISIKRSPEPAIPLSGSFSSGNSPGPFLSIEPSAISGIGGQTLVVPFALATTSAEQLSLVWNEQVLDETPPATACSGWCAGSYDAQIGSNLEGYGDVVSPLSMERISDSSDGTQADSWRSTDSYAPWLASNTGYLWGTPGSPNSAGLPEYGVFCGASDALIVERRPYHPISSTCVFLTKFVTQHANIGLIAALYRGTVSSSTSAGSWSIHSLATTQIGVIPLDAQSGEEYFFAIWERRIGPAYNDDNARFKTYFTTGSAAPPHGQYVTIPWTYQ